MLGMFGLGWNTLRVFEYLYRFGRVLAVLCWALLIVGPAMVPTSLFYSESKISRMKRWVSTYKWMNLYYADRIYHLSKYNQVRPGMIMGISNEESWGNPDAVSVAGAVGLMQVIPKYHYVGKNPQDLKDPMESLRVGTQVYKECLVQAGGNEVEALKNYNSGPHSTYYNKPYIDKVIYLSRLD